MGSLQQQQYDVLFVRCVCKYADKRWEIYSFFSVGKRREGKSSFADVAFGAGSAVCKCAFSFAVGFSVWFVKNDGRILFTNARI